MAGPELQPISALEFDCGAGFSLGEGSRIGGIGGPANFVKIGRQVTIGEGVHIAAPSVVIGDYVTVHRNSTLYGYAPVTIGHATWVGQNVVLNCTNELRIGRGCVISAHSNVWTHFAGGDVLQGCRYDESRPVNIADDAWIGVGASIAPVDIGARSLILAGAVVTKLVPANTVWGGSPANDLTAKLGPPFVETSLQDRYRLLCELLRRHKAGTDIKTGRLPKASDCPLSEGPVFTIGGISVVMGGDAEALGGSVFDVRDRTFSATGSAEEIAFMRALLYRVKFFPR